MANAVTVNTRIQFPIPGVEVVDVTAAASADYYITRFSKIDGVAYGMKSTTGTAGDIKFDYTTTAGKITITTGGTNTRLTLVIFGH